MYCHAEKHSILLCLHGTVGLHGDQASTASPRSQVHVSTEQCSTDNSANNSCTYEEHPNHLVIVNTNPDFGNSLSALVNEDT